MNNLFQVLAKDKNIIMIKEFKSKEKAIELFEKLNQENKIANVVLSQIIKLKFDKEEYDLETVKQQGTDFYIAEKSKEGVKKGIANRNLLYTSSFYEGFFQVNKIFQSNAKQKLNIFKSSNNCQRQTINKVLKYKKILNDGDNLFRYEFPIPDISFECENFYHKLVNQNLMEKDLFKDIKKDYEFSIYLKKPFKKRLIKINVN